MSNMTTQRQQLAAIIYKKLLSHKEDIRQQLANTPKEFTRFAFVDNLLPENICTRINQNFPPTSEMKFAANFREKKHVARSTDLIKDILADITFAFQDQKILDLVGEISGIKSLLADPNLYGSGLSSMISGDFLNPHLDNSHDQFKKNKRVLNLLYYVSPDWQSEFGGNLEIWDKKAKKKQEILSKFNRLVIMETTKTSFHSVTPVVTDQRRNCVSNYFFVNSNGEDFHISTFKARPGETMSAIKINLDTVLRKGIRIFFKKGIFVPDTFLRSTEENGQKSGIHRLGIFIRDKFLYK